MLGAAQIWRSCKWYARYQGEESEKGEEQTSEVEHCLHERENAVKLLKSLGLAQESVKDTRTVKDLNGL